MEEATQLEVVPVLGVSAIHSDFSSEVSDR